MATVDATAKRLEFADRDERDEFAAEHPRYEGRTGTCGFYSKEGYKCNLQGRHKGIHVAYSFDHEQERLDRAGAQNPLRLDHVTRMRRYMGPSHYWPRKA